VKRFAKYVPLAALSIALVFSTTGCETLSCTWDWLFGSDDPAAGAPVDTGAGLGTGGEGVTGFGTENTVPSRPGEGEVGKQVKLPTIYLAYDQFTIGTTQQAKLEETADYLIKYANVKLLVEGHCDERGSIEYNRALGEKRAIAVKEYLVKLGIPETRISTISYGEDKPAVQGSDESAFSKNRRAELVGSY